VITVANGTGLVGTALTQALVGDGEQARVLTRDPKAALADFGYTEVEIVGVDFDDASTLRAGFTGSDTAFMSYGTSEPGSRIWPPLDICAGNPGHAHRRW
jgi:uncharacterized protein YbjT (DUF2867 family)